MRSVWPYRIAPLVVAALVVLFVGLVTSRVAAQETPVVVTPAEVGDLRKKVTCPVSGKRHQSADYAVRFRGRLFFPGDAACRDAFMAKPDQMAANVEPRSGLFHTPDPSRESSFTLVIIGLFVVLALVCGAFAAYIAVDRGYPGINGFLLGLLLNVIGVAVMLARPKKATPFESDGLTKVPVTHASVGCPSCGHANHPSARRCLRCGRELTPAVESEVQKIRGGA